MARPTKSELARQLRGHVELLQAGGLSHIAISRKATAATPAKPKPAPAARPAAVAAPAVKAFKPVIVPSVAHEELKAFEGAPARELEKLAEQVRVCGNCRLCSSRTQTVFGTGNPNSRLMIVGEAPGGDEDIQGKPFVGRAGQLLTEIIEKGMKLRRADVYIANVLKCRPPDNRNPEPDEIEACRGYLESQIEAINPDVILAVGRFPAQWLANSALPIGQLRGKVFEYKSRKVVCTYHPAYLLRNYTLDTRKKVHSDVLLALELLGRGSVVRQVQA
ncbi:Type-4 uracil-DNA glycosylase [Planctomycetaceae bacterium]|nr:Type-4 uracil-DNA glycosylase [Planctomycetaceae bacterium]